MKKYVSVKREGYNVNLCFKDQVDPRASVNTKRKRNVIWFKPPFNMQDLI